jgi:16S rRNA (adenine1518-N6/adenine1519-N6)-dimethyltransferase
MHEGHSFEVQASKAQSRFRCRKLSYGRANRTHFPCARQSRDEGSSLNAGKKEGNVPKVSASPRRSHKPKLGQHFLIDDAAAMRIVEALGDVSQCTVLEIGPGHGALTSLLARRVRRLIAIELDRVLAAQLRMNFSLTPNVEIIEGDILAIDFDTIFGPKPGSTRPGIEQKPEQVRVVGNLPYFITSDILLRLFELRRYFEMIVLMVQREVADRLAAPPGGSDYGLLSATAQLYARIEKLFTLPPGAFSPPPKVQSTVVRLTIAPKLESLHVPEAAFVGFLKLCFGQKRKTLWNNLKSRYKPEALRAAFAEAGVKPTVRSEALSLEKTAALFRALPSVANASEAAGEIGRGVSRGSTVSNGRGPGGARE